MLDTAALQGAVLLLETSEDLPSAQAVKRIVRGLGERGYLEAVAGIPVARPPVSASDKPLPTVAERRRLRNEQCDTVLEQITHDNPEAVVCVGVPFGHTRPQWIIPHAGTITLNGNNRTMLANYDEITPERPRIPAA